MCIILYIQINGGDIIKRYNPIDSVKEKAILVGHEEESLGELAELSLTAGVEVIGKLLHRGDNINPAYYIGSGKLQELREYVLATDANVIIFDNDLSPAQFHNLESSVEVKIIDRTQLILDIFALHAHTKESKLQVELAQLEYLLPKLRGKGHELSRLGGGIGTRGPGETKLEIDRRRIQNRIHKLKSELKNIKKNRREQRKTRHDPIVALVGYTNAGKSTLMNLLTSSNTKVADQLFATLDSTLRKIKLPIGRTVIISDTVGFINKLPHQLVASFSTTLEEIKDASILLHVVDVSQPDFEKQIKVVNKVLKDLGVEGKNIVLVFNKIDLIDKDRITELELRYPDSICVSALNETGKDKLISRISRIILEDMVTVELDIPYSEGQILDIIHREGNVLEEKYLNDKIFLRAKIEEKTAAQLAAYRS